MKPYIIALICLGVGILGGYDWGYEKAWAEYMSFLDKQADRVVHCSGSSNPALLEGQIKCEEN